MPEYTEQEEEMLEIYARFRIDGVSRARSLALLCEMDYHPTAKALKAIREHDSVISFNCGIKNNHDAEMPIGRWQKCLDSESKCEGAKVELPILNRHDNKELSVMQQRESAVMIPVNTR